MSDQRAEFSRRLVAAMTAMNLEPRPSVLLARFNSRYRGKSVSFETVSRWLRGQGIPSQDKLVVLAQMFRIEPQALRYGEKTRLGVRELPSGWLGHVSPQDAALFEEFMSLPAKQRDIVRNLIEALSDAVKRPEGR